MKTSPKFITVTICSVAISFALLGCNPRETDPNILYSDSQADPLQELETDDVIKNNMPYHQMFYVPVYSNIYVDEDNRKVMLSATLSIRNTSLTDHFYVTKIDYYNTQGDFVRPYLDKPIELPPLGTLNYIVEKQDDTGGHGANFVIDVEANDHSIEPLIETVMIGTFSNKAFSFTSDAMPINDD